MGIKTGTETDIVKAILQYLALRGVIAFRNNNTGLRRRTKSGREFWAAPPMRGASDIYGLLPATSHDFRGTHKTAGRFMSLEVKKPGGRPTKDQVAFIDIINRSGGLAMVVSSVEDVIAALEKEGY